MKSSLILGLFLLMLSSQSKAVTHCPSVSINYIQVTDTMIEIKVDNIRHLVGDPTTFSADKKLSILLTAQASKQKVQLIFEADNYSCNTETLSSRLYGVRIID